MPVTTPHSDYSTYLPHWKRARTVLAGEDAVKAAGEQFLPALTDSTPDQYAAYKLRASFFNATARTADAYLGLIFRRVPFMTLPEPTTPAGRALDAFVKDCDLLGTGLDAYARALTAEIISVGRYGSLLDWSPEENRAYVAGYAAEEIINWRVERINGRSVLSLLVLSEPQEQRAADPFTTQWLKRFRVLRLVDAAELKKLSAHTSHLSPLTSLCCVVEIWNDDGSGNFLLADRHVPLRAGRPLPLIPFVFHGSRHSRPDVDKLPLNDLIAVNLHHYRLSADHVQGLHFTAIPTAWVAGFTVPASGLKLGSLNAWAADNPSARAGFLEFSGAGLDAFESAMDRAERQLAVLGSRMLEPQKRVGETAEAIELRSSGESSVLSSLALSVSESLTQVLRWIYWWHSQDAQPDEAGADSVALRLNTDFSLKGLAPEEIKAVVTAWQAGAITENTMQDLFRRGELLPETSVVHRKDNGRRTSDHGEEL